MLAWTKQNTMQRAMRTVLEWPQSHATRKTINMITNKYKPQQKCLKSSQSFGGVKTGERNQNCPPNLIKKKRLKRDQTILFVPSALLQGHRDDFQHTELNILL